MRRWKASSIVLKTNELKHESYTTRVAAKLDLFEDIEGFYNLRRRRSSIGNRTPIQQYEAWFEKEISSIGATLVAEFRPKLVLPCNGLLASIRSMSLHD